MVLRIDHYTHENISTKKVCVYQLLDLFILTTKYQSSITVNFIFKLGKKNKSYKTKVL